MSGKDGPDSDTNKHAGTNRAEKSAHEHHADWTRGVWARASSDAHAGSGRGDPRPATSRGNGGARQAREKRCARSDNVVTLKPPFEHAVVVKGLIPRPRRLAPSVASALYRQKHHAQRIVAQPRDPRHGLKVGAICANSHASRGARPRRRAATTRVATFARR